VNGEGRPGGNATKTADQLAKAKTDFIARSQPSGKVWAAYTAQLMTPYIAAERATLNTEGVSDQG
jgi:hypothetical protein